jgi:hypothetical protein
LRPKARGQTPAGFAGAHDQNDGHNQNDGHDQKWQASNIAVERDGILI